MAEEITYEPTRNDTVAVGTSSTVISNPRNQKPNRRKVWIIRNISPNATDIVTINLGENLAIANKGIVLRQYESVSDSSEDVYQCWQGVITAICATATGSLAVFER